MSAACTPEFIKFVAETYFDDFNGYRADILGMKPAAWQDRVGHSLIQNKRTVVSAGHGIGKTAFAAAAIHWFAATRPRFAIVATASTDDQLQKKLWRELFKVNSGARNADWFQWKQSTFTRFDDPLAQAVALPNNENNPGAFAGTHEDHVLGVFDEGADISRAIYQVFNGAMTTAGARWLTISNPRRAEGYFYDAAFGKLAARKPGDTKRGMWQPFIIPSTDSPFVDPEYERDMRLAVGEDSDDYRVQVLGLPPRVDAQQFINREHVTAAMARQIDLFERWPLILGCDVGRGDRSVIVPRRGRKVLDAIQVLNGERTMDFAQRIANEIRFWRDEHDLRAQVILEELGMGVGVVETLEDMGFADQVWGVNTGASASESGREIYTNLRCEMWGELRTWLEGNVELPNNPELLDDLTVIKRKPNANGKLRLETKDEMRRRGVRSPDLGDALALTFAVPFDLLPDRRSSREDAWGDPLHQPAPSGQSWMSF